MANRQVHDAAHQIAVGILRLLAPDLSEEVQTSFYRNVMPIIVNGIAKDVPMSETYKGVFPFLAWDALRVMLLLAFPMLSLGLVRLLYGSG